MLADEERAPLLSGMASLFNSELYSDLEVRCSNGDCYHAHKFVLCTQSEVFAKACDPKLGFKESQEHVLNLNEDSPAVIKALLEYLYRFDYTHGECEPAFLFHAQVYSIGEIYGVNGLKALARGRFEDRARIAWIDSSFGPAVKAVYDSTVESDRGLRDVVVDVTVRNFARLMKDKHFMEAMDETGAFGRDVAMVLFEEKEMQEERRKRECMYAEESKGGSPF